MNGYINPAYHNDPLAAEFDEYLSDHLDWSAEGFGGSYAWDTAIPPRETWEEEVEMLNRHLADRDVRCTY